MKLLEAIVANQGNFVYYSPEGSMQAHLGNNTGRHLKFTIEVLRETKSNRKILLIKRRSK